MTSILLHAAVLLLLASAGCAARVAFAKRKREKMEAQVVEARKVLEQMSALVALPGWKVLEEAAQKHIKTRVNEVTLKPTEDPLAQEYMKGEVQGLTLFISIPAQLIEMNKDIIDTAKKLEEEVG